MSPNRTFSDDIHEVSTLEGATQSLDSNSSVGTGSPTLLNSDSPLGSHGTPSVKFAPLPQIDPSRRRSLVPLGVSGRSRRKRAVQQEAGSLLWHTDPDAPRENMEDPLITFAKFVKKTGTTLWRRMRRGSKVPHGNASRPPELVLDIRPIVHPGDIMAQCKRVSKAVEDKRGRRASWSSSDKRRTLSLDDTKRRSTSDLVSLRVIV